MRKIGIKDKLTELGTPVEQLMLGDFDIIGEHTAKKTRGRDNELYRTVGCVFRPNYERGMLAHALIKRYRPKRILEIGFGRGYWSTCAAKAVYDLNIDCEITTVDPQFNKQHIELMSNVFPGEWLQHIKMVQGRSVDVIPKLEGEFDIVYIDGDHTYSAVKADWEAVQDRFRQFAIFDDYHMSTTKETNEIQVARAVDEINDAYDKELVIMDREIFADDRLQGPKDYGQVVIRSPRLVEPISPYDYNW